MSGGIFTEALAIPLFHRALAAGLLVSIACGVIGSYVVVKRISSISGGLSHTAFGGVGLAYFFGFSPLLGALGFCLACSVLLGVVYQRRRESLDTLISILWAVGMAVGMVFIALVPGYAPDLSSYLFGSIIFVPENYLFLCAALDVAILLVVALYYKQFQAVSFDEEFSAVAGLKVEWIFILLLLLTSLTVVMLIRVAGVILTIALLTTPAVIARHWSSSFTTIMRGAVYVSALCIGAGLFGAFWLSARKSIEVPTGPLIILIVTGVYIVSSFARWFLARGTLE